MVGQAREGAGERSPLRVLVTVMLVWTATLGCDISDPAAPAPEAVLESDRPRAEVQFDRSSDIHELSPISRFSLSIRVVDALRLDAPIRLQITTLANFDTPDFEVQAVLPELEVALANNGRLVPSSGIELTPAMHRGGNALLRSGARVDEFSVTFPYPGYWRVVATARRVVASEVSADADWVNDVTHRELWMYTDGERWATTDDYDESVFSEDEIPGPGPLKKRTSEISMAQPASPLGSGPMLAVETTQFRVEYYNSDALQYEPVAGATVQGIYYDWNLNPVFSSLHTTDSQGNFNLSCNTSYVYGGDVKLVHSKFTLGNVKQITFYGCEPGWDDPSVLVISSPKGRIWRNMVPAINKSASLFSQTRSIVPVVYSTSTSCNAYYSPGSDQITICAGGGSAAGGVWGTYGTFVAPHEYGHAFHEKALGGNEGSGACGSHYLFAAHNLQCAFSEGFADFFAALTQQDLLPATDIYEDSFERPLYNKSLYKGLDDEDWCKGVQNCPSASQQTTDGGRAELAVAAFLYDLADNASTANYQPTTDDDPVAYGAQYVANVVQTCQVRQGSTWIRANGLDHLVYCFERRLANYASLGYFPTRATHPNSWSTSASLPGGWNANTIKGIWQGIAFAAGPPSIPLTAQIGGPTELEPNEPCTWQALVTGGTPPYTYSWSGALSGSNSWVSGSLSTSSNLFLTVTSSDSQQSSPSLSIAVFSGANECLL
jgi:hypothetical protein